MVKSHLTELVLITVRVHLFPSRTQKLSSRVPTILGGRLPGKIGNANMKTTSYDVVFCYMYRFPPKTVHRTVFCDCYSGPKISAKFVKKCLTKGDASGSICKSPDEKRRLGGRQKAQKNLKKLEKSA